METIQFQSEVGNDNTIRIPEGVTIPRGQVTVTVVPSPELNDDKVPGTWKWLREMALEAEQIDTDLPSDMAANHDYYAHGKPRQ